MKDRYFVFVFLIGYFLSIDAAMNNLAAGVSSWAASTAGLTIIAMTQPTPPKKES